MTDILSLYRNRILNEDTLEVLKRMPDNSLDMIYGDPDYGVGVNYAGKKYEKKWDEYIKWYVRLATESMRVLKPTGNLFFINYPKQNSYLRVQCLDDISHIVHEYVWVYNTNIGHSGKKFTTAHRSILHATKSKNNHFYKDNVAQPYKNPDDRRIKARMRQGEKGRMPYSWFYFNLVKNVSKDKTFHSCQIPLGLVEILIKSCTQEHDDCFILFGGSGSELVLCKELGRNFISCEIHEDYHSMILDRLNHNGHIKSEYRLPFRQNGRDEDAMVSSALF